MKTHLPKQWWREMTLQRTSQTLFLALNICSLVIMAGFIQQPPSRANQEEFTQAWLPVSTEAGSGSTPVLTDKQLEGTFAKMAVRHDSVTRSACQADRLVWRSRYPPSRTGHAMTYDSERGKVVMFSGKDDKHNLLNDMWMWDGMDWVELTPEHLPPRRVGHAMTYDSERKVIVLFGGENRTDTWEWNGNDWIERSSTIHPPVQQGHAMVYDSKRHVVVMVGGNAFGTTVWEWDGIQWVERSFQNGPSAARDVSAAYDEVRGVTVLFGGRNNNNNQMDETWEWNGSSWTRREPRTKPPSTYYQSGMTFDTRRGVVILYKVDADGNHTWEWNGTDWAKRSSAVNPGNRTMSPLTYDNRKGVTVLFGGGETTNGGDTWEWNGENWNLLGESPPSQRIFPGVAYQNKRGSLLFVGGERGEGDFPTDTWESDGSGWVKRDIYNGIGAYGHYIAYDSRRDVVVVFGGRHEEWDCCNPPIITYLRNTWEWNGANWRLRTTDGPSARTGNAISYDRGRGVVVLFGGRDLGYSWFNDTWEWDGVRWQQRLSPDPPPAGSAQMVYDDNRAVTVLSVTNQQNKETWEWNGVTWTNRNPANQPNGGLMTYDAGRKKVVVLSVTGEMGLWEWDGMNWTRCPSDSSSAPNDQLYAMAYDMRRQVFVGIGSQKVWEYGPEPRFQLSQDHLAFQASPGATRPVTQTLSISIVGVGTPRWSALTSASWLAISPTQGIAPSALTVSVKSDGLPRGEYSSTITFTGSTSVLNSPQVIPVSLRVGESQSYLPLIARRRPPVPDAPVLNAIAPPGANPGYTVSWNAAYLAEAYILDQATDASFSDATQVYTDTATSKIIRSEGIATYYYRVKARNQWGDSPWSNVQAVEVRWEREPNYPYNLANGPLVSGRDYYGYPNDDRDYFKFQTNRRGQIAVDLGNHTGKDVQLILYHPAGVEVAKMTDPPYHLPYHLVYTGDAGEYYVQIYSIGGFNSNSPYTLRVTFP